MLKVIRFMNKYLIIACFLFCVSGITLSYFVDKKYCSILSIFLMPLLLICVVKKLSKSKTTNMMIVDVFCYFLFSLFEFLYCVLLSYCFTESVERSITVIVFVVMITISAILFYGNLVSSIATKDEVTKTKIFVSIMNYLLIIISLFAKVAITDADVLAFIDPCISLFIASFIISRIMIGLRIEELQ